MVLGFFDSLVSSLYFLCLKTMIGRGKVFSKLQNLNLDIGRILVAKFPGNVYNPLP